MLASHTYPPSQPVPLVHRQKLAVELLNHAYAHLCERFPSLIDRDSQRDNIDARLLLTFARDAVVREAEMLHKGTTIGELESLVKWAERKQ